MKTIQLDGQAGGGQMLRTALSLALITGQPFRMTNIRGQRRKPGLMRQHLTCVRAAAAISNGIADGAEIGSTELVFRSEQIEAGDYEFSIGTAGSTTLLLQTLLPALWQADRPSRLRLSGGTHNPLAPCYDFIERVFLPQMNKLGAKANLTLVETGFAPSGGGCLDCEIEPATQGFSSLTAQRRGPLAAARLTVICRQLNPAIAERLLAAIQKEWPCEETSIVERNKGPGQGLICLAEAEFAEQIHMVTGCAERGISAEKLGHRIGRSMNTFLGTDAPVGRHLADQLLLPMALAGEGEFLTTAPDDHVPTNMAVIEKFLPVRFETIDQGGGHFLIRCETVGA